MLTFQFLHRPVGEFLSTNPRPAMLRVLPRVGPAFRRKALHNETAINDRGFEVDFVRRVPVDACARPFRFSADEHDPWPAQSIRASVLLEAPTFEHVVVSVTGKMALMRTMAARTFMECKRWMAESAPHRPPLGRRRDSPRADVVQALLDEGLLVPGCRRVRAIRCQPRTKNSVVMIKPMPTIPVRSRVAGIRRASRAPK
ncbi:MAG: hypothetical protein KA387_03955 [Rubrivivax sp.]|nr:hypothetical protein [Rubrivivax sp.]